MWAGEGSVSYEKNNLRCIQILSKKFKMVNERIY